MKHVEVMVSPDAEEFYLSCSKGWASVKGHLIKVDELEFSAVPVNDYILVSEVESGAKLINIPVPDTVESYEETMFFLEINVASRIVMIIEKIGIDEMQKQVR